MKSKGLGDSIDKITTATGIKKVVKALFGDDCGCEERRIKLNKLLPYKIECLNENEFNYLDTFDWNKQQLDRYDQQRLLGIYNRIFNLRHEASSCRTCWINILEELKIVYEEYKNNL